MLIVAEVPMMRVMEAATPLTTTDRVDGTVVTGMICCKIREAPANATLAETPWATPFSVYWTPPNKLAVAV